jgi:hypothetical protein
VPNLTGIFLAIQLLLKLIGLWESFLDWVVEKHSQEIDARAEARRQAIEKAKEANTDDEIWQSQTDITKNMPGPP